MVVGVLFDIENGLGCFLSDRDEGGTIGEACIVVEDTVGVVFCSAGFASDGVVATGDETGLSFTPNGDAGAFCDGLRVAAVAVIGATADIDDDEEDGESLGISTVGFGAGVVTFGGSVGVLTAGFGGVVVADIVADDGDVVEVATVGVGLLTEANLTPNGLPVLDDTDPEDND